VEANRAQVDAWERFALELLPGSDPLGDLAVPDSWRPWARKGPPLVAIRSCSGHYLCVDAQRGNVLVCDRTRHDAWEHFSLIDKGTMDFHFAAGDGGPAWSDA
jgi:hypothetical protein